MKVQKIKQDLTNAISEYIDNSKLTHRELGSIFGVVNSQVSRIKSKNAWSLESLLKVNEIINPGRFTVVESLVMSDALLAWLDLNDLAVLTTYVSRTDTGRLSEQWTSKLIHGPSGYDCDAAGKGMRYDLTTFGPSKVESQKRLFASIVHRHTKTLRVSQGMIHIPDNIFLEMKNHVDQ